MNTLRIVIPNIFGIDYEIEAGFIEVQVEYCPSIALDVFRHEFGREYFRTIETVDIVSVEDFCSNNDYLSDPTVKEILVERCANHALEV